MKNGGAWMPFGKVPPSRIEQRIQGVNCQGNLAFALRVGREPMPLMLMKLGSMSDHSASFPLMKVLLSASLCAVRESAHEASACLNQSSGIGGFWRSHQRVRFAQECGHGQKHPSLGPSHVCDSDSTEAQNAIVKKAPLIPHVIHGPLEHRARQFGIFRVEVFKRKERDDTLRHTMNVHGIRAVVKISRRAVRAEKVGSVELKTAPDTRFELHCSGIAANGLQRAQVVAGMEVVNPSL